MKVLLVILDGWGWSPIKTGNLLLEADTPGLDTLTKQGHWTLLRTASLEIGLAWGKSGDSELGHYNLGTGRIVVLHKQNAQSGVYEIRQRNQVFTAHDRRIERSSLLAGTEDLQTETSLGGILALHGYETLKIGHPEKRDALLDAMNGYPKNPLEGETFYPIEYEAELPLLLRHSPELLERDLLVINLSAADRAAHLGRLKDLHRAIDETDALLIELAKIAHQAGAILYLVGDHGNIEQMLDSQDRPDTNHTTNPVLLARIDFRRQRPLPSWKVHPRHKEHIATAMPTGVLADVAPTILHDFALPLPQSMVGIDLMHQLFGRH